MSTTNEILTPTELIEIKNLHENISKSDAERSNKLLTINTTIFAIVVTLTSFDKSCQLLFTLYLTTLIIFVISILSGFILSNRQSNLYRKTLDKYIELIVDVKTGVKQKTELVVSSGIFYEIIFYFFYVSTYLAIISLAAFTIVKQLI
jgi:hypothetical protein